MFAKSVLEKVHENTQEDTTERSRKSWGYWENVMPFLSNDETAEVPVGYHSYRLQYIFIKPEIKPPNVITNINEAGSLHMKLTPYIWNWRTVS